MSLVELRHSHTTTQSHWSSGSTVCSPPRGAMDCVPGMHPQLQWSRVLLLAMSCYMSVYVVTRQIHLNYGILISTLWRRVCLNNIHTHILYGGADPTVSEAKTVWAVLLSNLLKPSWICMYTYWTETISGNTVRPELTLCCFIGPSSPFRDEEKTFS
jgi:hypothetical protein